MRGFILAVVVAAPLGACANLQTAAKRRKLTAKREIK